MTRSPPQITYHPLLSTAECRVVRDRIWSLREYWIPRNERQPVDFFTVGAAAYLDVLGGSDPQLRYYGRIAILNRLMAACFGTLLDAVRGIIAGVVQDEVVLAEDLAVPGFHIFIGDAIRRASTAGAHLDMQYEQLPWKGDISGCVPLSFTLPIAIPRAGAGLTTWPLSADELPATDSGPGPMPIVDVSEQTVCYPYAGGILVLQHGLMLHCIAPTPYVEQEDERITLQGHALRCNGRWILYW